jgi:hypothetical protein
MPKIQLLHPRKLGDGKTFKEYAKGVHEVSQATYDHWFTQAEMKAGNATNPFDVKSGVAGGVPVAVHQKLIGEHEALKLENKGLREDLEALLERDDGKGKSSKKA